MPFLVSSPKLRIGDLASVLMPYYAQPAKPFSHWLRYEQRTGNRLVVAARRHHRAMRETPLRVGCDLCPALPR